MPMYPPRCGQEDEGFIGEFEGAAAAGTGMLARPAVVQKCGPDFMDSLGHTQRSNYSGA